MSVTERGTVASEVVLPNAGGDVTREAILEYARAVSPRYLAASKREKGVILDEFCKTTGRHRKSAVRLLCKPPRAVRSGLGRPRSYGLARVPFGLEEIHTDNGGEFINSVLYPWCKKEGIRFTRGRAYKKNDQAYVEQKNWSVPRRLIGYDRYNTKAAYEQMQCLYESVCLYVNFFQPSDVSVTLVLRQPVTFR
jgi:hypothetical protein